MSIGGFNGHNTLATAISVATIVLGALGVSGHVMNPALGWIAVGLGSGTLLLNFVAKANFKEKTWAQVFLGSVLASGLITIGVLGGLQVLSTSTTGWAMIGSALVSWAIHCCCNPKDPAVPVALLLNSAIRDPSHRKGAYIVPSQLCCGYKHKSGEYEYVPLTM